MGHSKPIIPVDNCITLLIFRKAFIIFGSMEDRAHIPLHAFRITLTSNVVNLTL
jgi:hypothetical protein